MDRFTIVEMDVLDNVQELELLQYMFPNVDVDNLSAIAEIANTTRVESSSETGKIDSTGISTRTSVEMGGLMFDGFGLDEKGQVSVYPQFSNDGGVDSERTFVKLVQKYINDEPSDDLFNEDELDDEYDTDY